MPFCSACGGKTARLWYDADQRFRDVCVVCSRIQYDNPKLIVWCFAYWNARLVLCRRAIEPALGLWNAPSGFVEGDETLEEAAARETREETGLEISPSRMILYRVACIPHIKQVWVGFRTELEAEPAFAPGPESLEVKLFAEEEIPLHEFAFHDMIPHVPHDFFRSLREGEFTVKSEVVRYRGSTIVSQS
jgi:ADP-ribose pyrophosphatase YjhB (NUDIX family)